MFANFHMCDIMLLIRAVLNIPYFRCLMFNLSGPCELFLLGPEL